ncbi:hypothetical protein KOX_02075 [Klebsiella michiganensis KCTC 1686]|uniref:Uncharacterized protein n=1 Tax=Klebsiella michiganensis (strain ATCC 8724 / DSM 4798 / JCM 20051 / NBRC 3318 / NRRL B-199 / KCTC 1686 / BUCSAV 143 / CCM 1901) TaxID=1006551 RepID=A0A0H3GY56_KLEM8|nr:hypothetical protein KOX_02075 [Klebsiella michiganensis KCTC 1686]
MVDAGVKSFIASGDVIVSSLLDNFLVTRIGEGFLIGLLIAIEGGDKHYTRNTANKRVECFKAFNFIFIVPDNIKNGLIAPLTILLIIMSRNFNMAKLNVLAFREIFLVVNRRFYKLKQFSANIGRKNISQSVEHGYHLFFYPRNFLDVVKCTQLQKFIHSLLF